MRLGKGVSRILCRVDLSYRDFLCEDGSMVVRLNKALYGLVESAKLWYQHLRGVLSRHGYKPIDADECVFMRDEPVVKVALHVDDMLFTTASEEAKRDFVEMLKREFKKITVSGGHTISYLGMEIDFAVPGEVTISQKGYLEDLIKYYAIKGNAVSPHTENLFEVNQDLPLLAKEDQDKLRSGTAKLLYLARRTYPELLPVVSILSTRVNKYTMEDEGKFVRALKYLNSYPYGGMTLRAAAGQIQVNAYVDAAHGVHSDGKSHTGCVITLGGGAIVTKCSKQKSVSRSSTEAELIGLCDSLPSILWVNELLMNLKEISGPVIIYEDNLSTIAMSMKGRSSKGMTKHLKVNYFLIKEYIDKGEVIMKHIRSEDMCADMLTKALTGFKYWKHLSTITGQHRKSRTVKEAVK
jgi:Reverse transcriptase (RNA-dependent DNA polymerase)